VPPASVRSGALVAPADFLGTAAAELNATSGTATYGPPYNTNGTPQSLLVTPANWAGVRQPIDTAQTFVLGPLAVTAANDPALKAALAAYTAAPAAQQYTWATNYADAVTKGTFVNGAPPLPPAADGPVPALLPTA